MTLNIMKYHKNFKIQQNNFEIFETDFLEEMIFLTLEIKLKN